MVFDRDCVWHVHMSHSKMRDYPIRNYEYRSRVLFTDALYQVETPKRRNYCNRSCGKGGFKRLPLARVWNIDQFWDTDFCPLINRKTKVEEGNGFCSSFLWFLTFLLDPRAQAKRSCIVLTKRLPESGINNVTRRGETREKERNRVLKSFLRSRSSRRRDRYVICEIRGNSFERNKKDEENAFLFTT